MDCVACSLIAPGLPVIIAQDIDNGGGHTHIKATLAYNMCMYLELHSRVGLYNAVKICSGITQTA